MKVKCRGRRVVGSFEVSIRSDVLSQLVEPNHNNEWLSAPRHSSDVRHQPKMPGF